mmetsp:Transcript_13309/g.30589  ORF Transcript_13309/g.30589 Transcript_13309/m.30589 type:complete len:80 (+) Transcript_13309:572-811(+)
MNDGMNSKNETNIMRMDLEPRCNQYSGVAASRRSTFKACFSELALTGSLLLSYISSSATVPRLTYVTKHNGISCTALET